MSTDDPLEGRPLTFRPGPSWRLVLFFFSLLAGAALAYAWFRPRPSPPPASIAGDPLLVEGRDVYLARCTSCHGPEGRGDGPIAKNLSGPPARDLTSREWKYGDAPEDVLRIIAEGTRESAMPGWKGTLSPGQIRAVAAYLYHLSGRPVPEGFRAK